MASFLVLMCQVLVRTGGLSWGHCQPSGNGASESLREGLELLSFSFFPVGLALTCARFWLRRAWALGQVRDARVGLAAALGAGCLPAGLSPEPSHRPAGQGLELRPAGVPLAPGGQECRSAQVGKVWVGPRRPWRRQRDRSLAGLGPAPLHPWQPGSPLWLPQNCPRRSPGRLPCQPSRPAFSRLGRSPTRAERVTEEAVPGPSVLPSGEPGVSGDFWGSQEGCQGPSRPSGRYRTDSARREGEGRRTGDSGRG